MWQETATKTFSEYDLTAVYADMTYIDQATQDLLYDWFFDSIVCDDEKFPAYYRRKLMRCEKQYHELLQLEGWEFDPTVSTYRERYVTSSNSGSDVLSGTTENSRSGSDTLTRDLTDVTITDKDLSNSQSTQSTGSNSDTQATASKNNPQSIAYAGAQAGKLPALSWTHMGAQAQTETNGETEGSSTTTGSNTEDSTVTGTHTGTDTHVISDSGSTETEQTTTHSNEGVNTEIYTGRDGLTPQEALLKARAWIVVSDAFDWLKDQMKDCFLSIIDL